MTTRDVDEARFDELACLAPLTPRASRADAVRLRCRSELARRAVRRERREARVQSLARFSVPALLGAVPVFYAAELLLTLLRVEGWVR